MERLRSSEDGRQSGLDLAHPCSPDPVKQRAGRGQGWSGMGVHGGWGECSHQGGRQLGPHSQLEEGIQEVLTAAQTSQSFVPGSTKAEAPRDERSMAWALG